MHDPTSRRSFLKSAGWAPPPWAGGVGPADEAKIQGFEEKKAGPRRRMEAGLRSEDPHGHRRLRRVQFGAAFSLQDHPNVEVVAVSDLFPDRCQGLAKACRCEKTYPSLEEMVKDDSIEAIFVATDAPSHCRHCIDVLKHGKHVATAVPAVWGGWRRPTAVRGGQEVGPEVHDVRDVVLPRRPVRDAADLPRRRIRQDGLQRGRVLPLRVRLIPSYKDWRIGLPPQWYPTHSNAYYVGVTGGSFTEVSCMGMPSIRDDLQPENNAYKNPFGTEIALFRTSEGGMARMAVSWDTPGYGGEVGRVRGQQGSMVGMKYEGLEQKLPEPGKAAASARRQPAATAARTATWATSSSRRSSRTASRWSTSPGR